MPKIGILLPGSTLYPSIGIDFLQGIKSCFDFYGETNIEWIVFPIGYGIKEKEIYLQAEKWLLSENADIVVLYAEDRLANILSPLFTAMGKLLIIANAGAHYPIAKKIISNTVFLSMNDCLHSFLTGKLCGEEMEGKQNAVMATSFYDGGYQHCHAMTNGFALGGGEVNFNFISQYQKEAFDITPVENFLEHNPGTNSFLCTYCGDMTPIFLEKITSLSRQFDLNLYGSPMMFDNSPGDFIKTELSIASIKGYTGWVCTLATTDNRNFLQHYLKFNNKEANLFSLQGWETALVANAYLKSRHAGNSVADALDNLKREPIASPRGVLKLNDSNAVLAPAYLVSASGDMEIVVEEVIDDISLQWQEMISQIPESEFSTWQNTYLCI